MSTVPQLGFVDAASRNLYEALGGGPNMLSTLRGFFRPLALARVVQRVVDFQTVETEEPFQTLGVVYALSASALELKPEGTRSWNWKAVYAMPELVLRTEDVIVYKGERFKVMRNFDFNEYGFVGYEIVNSYGRGA